MTAVSIAKSAIILTVWAGKLSPVRTLPTNSVMELLFLLLSLFTDGAVEETEAVVAAAAVVVDTVVVTA